MSEDVKKNPQVQIFTERLSHCGWSQYNLEINQIIEITDDPIKMSELLQRNYHNIEIFKVRYDINASQIVNDRQDSHTFLIQQIKQSTGSQYTLVYILTLGDYTDIFLVNFNNLLQFQNQTNCFVTETTDQYIQVCYERPAKYTQLFPELMKRFSSFYLFESYMKQFNLTTAQIEQFKTPTPNTIPSTKSTIYQSVLEMNILNSRSHQILPQLTVDELETKSTTYPNFQKILQTIKKNNNLVHNRYIKFLKKKKPGNIQDYKIKNLPRLTFNEIQGFIFNILLILKFDISVLFSKMTITIKQHQDRELDLEIEVPMVDDKNESMKVWIQDILEYYVENEIDPILLDQILLFPSYHQLDQDLNFQLIR